MNIEELSSANSTLLVATLVFLASLVVAITLSKLEGDDE